MNYWIFTTTEQKSNGQVFRAREIYEQRMRDKFWGLGEKTANRRALREGDQVVFYVGIPQKIFAGTATLASKSFEPSADERDKLSHGKELYRVPYGVWLREIQTWDEPRKVEDIVPNLSFVENKSSWGVYLQGGARQISNQDFRAIVDAQPLGLLEKLRSATDVESETEFALESHLEDFLDQNWDSIDFGSRLVRYRSDEQSGRQFPAGTWSIDFLCTDQSTHEFVVIELKKGKSSDSTVGQLARYMSWVQENLAKPNQKVRGLIIAKDVDEALSYAIKSVPNVSVLTYRIDFKLTTPEKMRSPHLSRT